MTIHRLFGPETAILFKELKEQPSWSALRKISSKLGFSSNLFLAGPMETGPLGSGFHLDAEDLSPNYYHLPILSAGFRTWEEKSLSNRVPPS